MKKVYILSILVLFAVSTFAQKHVGNVMNMPAQGINLAKTPTDTLLPGNMAAATGFTTYGVIASDGGGYCFGTNGYGDLAKGEQFVVVNPYKIEGAIYWFGGKVTGAGTGTCAFQVLSMDGTTGTTTTATGTATCPNTILKSDVVGWANFDTSMYLADAYVHTFSSVVNVSNDYCIGIDVTNLYTTGDSLGLVSTADGDGGSMELGWEKWSDGSWYTILKAWTLDLDLVIMPIVDMTPDGVAEYGFINGLKMNTYPNPAVNNVNLSYELQNNSNNVTVCILDAQGRIVEKMNLGSQNAGSYNINMDVTNYAAGTYYYTLTSDRDRMAIKMNITK